MKVNIQIQARCSECGDILWGEGIAPTALVYCSNSNCVEFNKKYAVPVIELEPAE